MRFTVRISEIDQATVTATVPDQVRGSLHDPSPAFSRPGWLVGATLVGVFAFAGPASAHVTINPQEATQGWVRAVRVPRAQRERRRVHRQARGEPAGRRAGGVGVDHAGARLDGGRRAGEAADADRGARRADHRGGLEDHLDGGRRRRRSSRASSRSSRSRSGRCPRWTGWCSRRCRRTPTARSSRWIEEPVDGKPAEQDPAPVLQLAAAPTRIRRVRFAGAAGCSE